MRRPTETIYSMAFRAQAFVGLLLVGWLVAVVFAAGAPAGMAMIVGVFAGVVSLACLMPYLTPRWFARPRHRAQFLPLVAAHLGLLLLYGFVGLSAVVVSDAAADVTRQLATMVLAVLVVTAALAMILGGKMCLANQPSPEAGPSGTVTEFVLPRVTSRPLTEEDDRQATLSQAS